MTLNTELASWGEPNVSADEESLLSFLDKLLEQRARGEEARPEVLLADSPELVREASTLIQAVECIEQFMASVMEHSAFQPDPPSATGAEMEAAVEEVPDPLPGKYRFRKFLGEG